MATRRRTRRPEPGASSDASASEPPPRLTSDDRLRQLVESKKAMLAAGVVYEDAYFTTPLVPDDEHFMKLYLMTIGPPSMMLRKRQERSGTHVQRGDGRLQPEFDWKKVLTACIGMSRKASSSRVAYHNVIGAGHEDPRTKHGAGHWVLCMVIFLPDTLRDHVYWKDIRDYWSCFHGTGKINGGLAIARLFGLRCHVMPDAAECIGTQDAGSSASATEGLFMPPGIVDVNAHLVV